MTTPAGSTPGSGRPDGTADTSRRTQPGRRVAVAAVRDEPITADECAEAVGDDAAGAVVTFGGVVRNHDGGRAVSAIEYVAHPAAGQVVAQVAADLAVRFPVDAVAVVHRVGTLAVGDVALAVAVSAAHRAEAFAAAAELVEEVKRRLPVWKRQVFPDGGHEWTGSA
ncbi:molybdenum cofactor biosynthesis protein MoaE [Georgenia sp. TF02-10]|uniref:molybdenum cofactor biosynthesis protein MoaE n=1 Tax=Georgenia sp. TF02-10 TaxID=2917725 RepID=UPI002111D591|nr:molybdenum cofactor biosynthesis protein MoaE [Georgenia sp. TF02-10]